MAKSIDFRPISIQDLNEIRRFTLECEIPICDFSFSNLYGWRKTYNTHWTILDDSLVIKFDSPRRMHPCFLFPIRKGGHLEDPDIIHHLAEYSQTNNYPFTLMSICPHCHEELNKMFPGDFTFFSDRDYCDYIYLRERLCNLQGKKLQSKRNHINRFEANHPNYVYEELTQENMQECFHLAQQWESEHNQTEIEKDENQSDEITMIRDILQNRQALDVKGGLIRTPKEGVVAFCVGSPINRQTFGIHIEKARRDIQGAYPIINREFAKRIDPKYLYINREEDLGIEGLRKSKLSYYPDILLPKETAILRHEEIVMTTK